MSNRSPQVVVAGHICIDIIPEFPKTTQQSSISIQPGQLYIMGPATSSAGGVVANTGLALHKLGVATSLVGQVGDDLFGRALLDILKQHGSEMANSMMVSAEADTSYSVVISPPGVDRAFLHCPGANDTFRPRDFPLDALESASLLHFGYPTLMEQVYSDGGAGLRWLFDQAQKLGVTTSLDMSMPDPNSPSGQIDWRAWLETVLPAVDLFVPSIDELAFMLAGSENCGSNGGALGSHYDLDSLRSMTQKLLDWGAKLAGLKLGEGGLYLRTGSDLLAIGQNQPAGDDRLNCEVLAPCFQVAPVGTTGAGDCTYAGLLAALLSGHPPAEAAVLAVATGACCVESADATGGICPQEEIVRRIEQGWPRLASPAFAEALQWHEVPGVWTGKIDKP